MLACSYRLIFGLVVSAFFLLASNVVSEAAVDCFKCHDRSAFQMRVIHKPAVIGQCDNCHNPHVAKFEGLLQQSIKKLCLSCHSQIADEMTQGEVHQPFKKGECLGCHNPHSSKQSGLLNDRLADTCRSCHSGLPQNVKYAHAPYAAGECGACHQPHSSANQNLLVKSIETLCYDCHSRSSIQQKHVGFPAEIVECGSCHNPHGSDRPAMIRNVLHEPYADGCSDCHVEKGAPVPIDTCLGCHPEVGEEMASSHNHLIRYKDNGCTACHTPHAGDDRRLLKGKEYNVCGVCHEATLQRWSEDSKFSHPKTDACSDCHAPHGSNHPVMAKAAINTTCNECHGLHGSFTHPIGKDVFDPRTGQVMTCISCHATKGSDFSYHTRLDHNKQLCIGCHTDR